MIMFGGKWRKKLIDGCCWYTTDFWMVYRNGKVVFHEIKWYAFVSVYHLHALTMLIL